MSGFVDSAKGLISIVRDGLITLILIALLAVPSFVNDRLKGAGFVKASIAGFDWQATVEDNTEKLKVAATTIESLQDQVAKTQAALKTSEDARQKLAGQVAAAIPDSPIAEAATQAPPVPTAQIVKQNDVIVKNSAIRADVLRQQIQLNNDLLAKVGNAQRQ